VTFSPAINLAPDHYFFRPEVEVTDGEFFWLSAAKPIVPPGTPFLPDLQSWTRNENLAPDWVRVGTDVVGGTPLPAFNASFTVTGTTGSAIPLPAALWPGLTTVGSVALMTSLRKRRLPSR